MAEMARARPWRKSMTRASTDMECAGQFLDRQLAIAVLVDALKQLCVHAPILGRQLAVVILVARFDDLVRTLAKQIALRSAARQGFPRRAEGFLDLLGLDHAILVEIPAPPHRLG